MFYSVVLLDGNELHCLSLEEVQDLFFKRQINQNSLICSAEDGKWQMLRRTFDVAQWVPAGAPSVPPAQNAFQPQNNPFQQAGQPLQPNNFPPPQNPFEQPASANQPVTFNQFPPTQANNSYTANASNGYSQNNQTETYYQAETNQTNYNFQNNPTNFAPSKYSSPGNSYSYSPHQPNNFSETPGLRNGLRVAAGFLFVNLLLNIGYLILGSSLSESIAGTDAAYNTGQKVGSFLPLMINLLLAVKLWKSDGTDSARKVTLGLTYIGFILIGLIFPVIMLKTGNALIGGVVFVLCFFYFTALTLVLHGKENPSPSRLMVGTAAFAIYALMMTGGLGLAVIGKYAPEIAKLKTIENAQFEKYKVEGKEFQDKTTGAKVVLPEGWSMLNLDNPLIHTPEARMIAVDKSGNRLTMLEVVPVPGNLDMKRQNSGFILDQLSDGVVKAIKEQTQSPGFGGRNAVSEITRVSIFIGTHPAKLLVLDKTADGEKVKGHLIITYDELTFYVLHSWCPAAEYEQSQPDFSFFEKNFTVPDKINSTFTQSAENEQKR